MAEEKKIYLPKQNVRRGKAGYKGGSRVVVVDKDGKTSKAAPTGRTRK